MLDRTAELVNKCREWYAVYEFHRVYHAIHDYCVVDLSAFYFDVLKDRLYTKTPKSNPAAPHKPPSGESPAPWFASSRRFSFSLPKKSGSICQSPRANPTAVHLSLFPESQALASGLDKDASEKWAQLAQVRSAVLVALEQAAPQNHRRWS